MEKKWLIKNPVDHQHVESFRSELKVDRIVAELLLQRGINNFNEAEAFFRPELSDLHDPFLMKDMPQAVDRLISAIDQKEKVLFFGDYDVDGTTAVALMTSFFQQKELNLDYYIPDRYKEGYGLSKNGIDYAHENDITLIVALDCGIKSVELVKYGKSLGIDFIICDHHTPGPVLPDCIVLDPKRNDCEYPYKELCGCGVGFKLLQGVSIQKNWSFDWLYEHLDLVAISIGADIVPITGENRILCHHGMRLLNQTTRTSFKALLTLAKRSFPVTLTDVVFTIAPRINAAGRIYHGKVAVELMISTNENEIRKIAEAINDYNTERRSLDQQITEEALQLITEDDTFSSKKSTVVFDESWHKGVVGIVASRLIENHYRPTIVLTESEGVITGSARTVNDFNIHDALVSCEHLLEQFGGHKHAAGLTLKKDNLLAFQEAFDRVVQETIDPADLVPEEIVDLEINFDEIFQNHENRLKIPKLKRILNQLEPHGPGNMKPVFLSTNVFTSKLNVLKEKHLKMTVVQPNSDVALEAIAFNHIDHLDDVAPGIPFDMIYTLEVNRWNGHEQIQLNVKGIRPTI